MKYIYFTVACDVTLSAFPKVVGSIPTVARHIFQAFPVWKYTQSNITCILFTWVHYTITANIIFYRIFEQTTVGKTAKFRNVLSFYFTLNFTLLKAT